MNNFGLTQEILRDYEFCDLGFVTSDQVALEGVIALIQGELDRGPRSVDALNALGVALARHGSYDEAEKLFGEAVRADPSSWKVRLNRGENAIFRGQQDHAFMEVDEAMRLAPPTELRPFRVRARVYYEVGQFTSAIEDYDTYLEAHENDENTWMMRGVTHFDAGDLEVAMSDFDTALEIDPEAPRLLCWRAILKRRTQDLDGAIIDLTTAISLAPEDAKLYLHRGAVYVESEKYGKAIHDSDKVIEAEPQNTHGFHLRAIAHFELGDLERAKIDLTTAIELDPTNKAALKLRATVWEQLGAPENAEVDLQRGDQIAKFNRSQGNRMQQRNKNIYNLVKKHFAPSSLDDISISERRFPMRVRADLQRAIDRMLDNGVSVHHFCGVSRKHLYQGLEFSELTVLDERDPVLAVPPQYEEIDIGDDQLVRCLKSGIWLLEKDQQRFVFFLEPSNDHRSRQTIRFQLACVNEEAGNFLSRQFFKEFESSVASSECYRGKILSLEFNDRYSGTSSGITVHKLRQVEREQVILPGNRSRVGLKTWPSYAATLADDGVGSSEGAGRLAKLASIASTKYAYAERL